SVTPRTAAAPPAPMIAAIQRLPRRRRAGVSSRPGTGVAGPGAPPGAGAAGPGSAMVAATPDSMTAATCSGQNLPAWTAGKAPDAVDASVISWLSVGRLAGSLARQAAPRPRSPSPCGP